jgi:hypothetical protein
MLLIKHTFNMFYFCRKIVFQNRHKENIFRCFACFKQSFNSQTGLVENFLCIVTLFELYFRCDQRICAESFVNVPLGRRSRLVAFTFKSTYRIEDSFLFTI